MQITRRWWLSLPNCHSQRTKFAIIEPLRRSKARPMTLDYFNMQVNFTSCSLRIHSRRRSFVMSADTFMTAGFFYWKLIEWKREAFLPSRVSLATRSPSTPFTIIISPSGL